MTTPMTFSVTSTVAGSLLTGTLFENSPRARAPEASKTSPVCNSDLVLHGLARERVFFMSCSAEIAALRARY